MESQFTMKADHNELKRNFTKTLSQTSKKMKDMLHDNASEIESHLAWIQSDLKFYCQSETQNIS